MRTTLLLCLLSVSFLLLVLNLGIIHGILHKQIRRGIGDDLGRSIITFRNIQRNRQQMLRREVSLLAALPVLKSLMTTADAETIRDGATEFYHLSGGDLFALADPKGAPVALFSGGSSWTPPRLSGSIPPAAFTGSQTRYVLLRGSLYEVASEPLYFGTPSTGTRLGYVLLGYAVNRRVLEEVSQAAAAEVAVFAGPQMVATTLDPRGTTGAAVASHGAQGEDLWVGREHFVRASAMLSAAPDPPVDLVVLKSYDQASRYLTALDRIFLLLGAVLMLASAGLATYLATTITQPLERLVAGARALGGGNFDYQLRHSGAREMRELADAFDLMRRKLRSTQEDLLESERLATIGRMASSISHDLRHYLSAVFANAEFLGYENIDREERQDLMGEIRQGVRGMTDLIESLLFFSRTGRSLQLSTESLSFLVDRALNLVRAHPDAQNVRFLVGQIPQQELWLDALKVERAIYNLLLNGTQSARHGAGSPEVEVAAAEDSDMVSISITDNGPGVPESVRSTLFQPFVSEGKQSGTGLGLTIAQRVAQEHGGSVTLVESRPGRTVFLFSLAKSDLRRSPSSTRKLVKSAVTE